jgi:TetR/AcrR family transcriptional regulator
VLSAYIRSKIRISRDLPHASRCSPARSCTAPRTCRAQVEQLNEQARHNIECIQRWIDRGQIAHVDRTT